MAKAQPIENPDDKDNFVDELKPGTKLMHGQYVIESFLNAGGFGITYLARDSLDRKVVIKECFPGAFCRRSRAVVQARSRAHQNELKSIVRLFVQEARSLAKLDHPNIVGVHQVFEDNDTAYMALDFVSGRDMLDIIEDPNSSLTPQQTRNILKEILGAVGFIHDQQILHRDISPDNILINKDYHPVLIDFGAAREEATKQSRVLSALRVVKDGYSPQEFYIAGSEQTPSSDLYALAASFHHLIVGDVPPNSQARLAAIASGEPDPYQPISGRFPDYDDNFLAAMDKALAVLPKDRVQSAKDWLNMMDGNAGNVTALNVAGTAAAPAEDAPAAAPAKKSNMPVLMGSAAAIALLVGIGVFTMSGGEDPVAEAPVSQTEVTGTVAPAAPATDTTTAAAEEEPVVTEAPAAVQEPAATEDTPAVVEATPAEAPATTDEPVVAEEPAADVDTVTATIAELVTPEQTRSESGTVAPTAPVVPEQREVANTPTPTPTEEPALQQTENDTGAIVAGPAVTDQPVPDVRPTSRPVTVEMAAVPEVAPLPEPVQTPTLASEAPAPDTLPQAAGNVPSADTQIGDVTLPGSPDAIANVGDGPTVEILAVTPGNEIVQEPEVVEEPVETVTAAPSLAPAQGEAVASNWSVRLPFTAAGPNSNIIAAAGAVSPTWVEPGIVIVSVNGFPIESISQISDVLRLGTPEDSISATLPAMFGVSDPSTGDRTTQAWVLPVVQNVALADGTTFETAFAGSGWTTRVTGLATEQNGGLRVGDVVSSYIPESLAIDDRTTIADIFDRELANGVEQFTFAVQREGSLWIASYTYGGGE